MPSSTELFLDDELIEMTAGVTRRIHQPTKHRLNPVLRPEHWWEGDCIMPLATLYDPEEKLFKTWYRTGPLDRPEQADGHASFNGRSKKNAAATRIEKTTLFEKMSISLSSRDRNGAAKKKRSIDMYGTIISGT